MTVYFIGAGPGPVDLITLRGLRLIRSCSVCLYAGSLVSDEVIAYSPKDSHIINTMSMSLKAIVEEIEKAHVRGLDVARVHSGDPSLYSAIAEQMRELDSLHIPYEIIPGVPAFAAAAAVLKQELTLPGVNQSLIVSRTSLNSSPMPKNETLTNLCASRATLVLHLSVKNFTRIQAELVSLYGAECPVVVVTRVGWPDERILHGILISIDKELTRARLTRSSILFIGHALKNRSFCNSRLYAGNEN